MTLHKPSIRLAGLYLAIMMAVSVFFSANLYQLSVQELNRGLHQPLPGGISMRLNGTPIGSLYDEWLESREVEYQESKNRVLTRLIIVNLLIMVGGGMLSYALARRTLEPIEEAHDAQRRFTADASHELRTPIAAMQTETEVALMKPDLTLPQAKERLQSNLEELAKLSTLTDGLLKLARMEKSDLLSEKVALGDLVQQAVDRVLPLAEGKHILIKVEDDPGAAVTGDPESLVQSVVIILDNAVKYSRERSQVDVRMSTDRKHASVIVKDRGIGIKESELPHIFERFYRADAARSKTGTNGYGLGLAIAKQIVEAHGGTISVTSASGKGTTFTLKFPAA